MGLATTAPAEAGTRIASTSPRTGYRARRMARVVELIDGILARQQVCRIIDIGGTVDYWTSMQDLWAGRNIHLTIINLDPLPQSGPWYETRNGDARNLAVFPDGAFDLVHSNSVIEHVGRFADMQAMAREVRRLAPRYYVQTPAASFPVEPHFRAPFFHWLPEPVRLALVRRFAIGHYPKADSVEAGMKILEDAILLDRPRMEALFPDAAIVPEKVALLTKSWMAIR
jgi:hypothetical protein